MGANEGTLKFRFNPQHAGLTKVLGPLESDIMQIIWRLNQATVAEVHRELQQGPEGTPPSRRDMAYTTVMTTMSRLADKHVLHREKPAGQVSFLYTPALNHDEFVNLVVKNVMDGLVTEFGEPVFQYFVGYMAASDPERRAVLAQALAEPPA